MAYTTTDQLTKNGNSIENGRGSAEEFKALYYFKDIDLVQSQPGFHQLVQISVFFDRSDVPPRLKEISVLSGRDQNGDPILHKDKTKADEQGIHALPWVPFYDDQAPHAGTADFPGDPSYQAGNHLLKG